MKLMTHLQSRAQVMNVWSSNPPPHLHHVVLMKHRDNFASFLFLNNTYSMPKLFFISNDHDNIQIKRLVE
jgi:hypothetical protein